MVGPGVAASMVLRQLTTARSVAMWYGGFSLSLMVAASMVLRQSTTALSAEMTSDSEAGAASMVVQQSTTAPLAGIAAAASLVLRRFRTASLRIILVLGGTGTATAR